MHHTTYTLYKVNISLSLITGENCQQLTGNDNVNIVYFIVIFILNSDFGMIGLNLTRD